jgi:hypothetical protein
MVDATPILVDAPLRGEWVATQTPAHRVPSHGTDYLGQRFAFDFVRLKLSSNLPYERGFWRHLLVSLPAQSFLCWDEPVLSVADGVVAIIGEGWPDRLNINLGIALLGSLFRNPRLTARDFRPLAGNYVVVESEAGVAFYAHLRRGSIRVHPGQAIQRSEVIGNVGNSGNTTMPHLHFHMMDRPNVAEAKGIACRFRRYERFRDGQWELVREGIPARLERIRWLSGP